MSSLDIMVFVSCYCCLGDSHCDSGERDPRVWGTGEWSSVTDSNLHLKDRAMGEAQESLVLLSVCYFQI